MKIGRVQIPEYISRNFNKYKYVLLVCLVGLLLAAWPTGQPDTSQQSAHRHRSWKGRWRKHCPRWTESDASA